MAQQAYQQALELPARMGSPCHAEAEVMNETGSTSRAVSVLANACLRADGLFQPAPTATGQSLQAIRRQTAGISYGDAANEQPLFGQSLRNLWAVKVSG